MLMERQTIEQKDRWNVDALFSDLSSWQTEFNTLVNTEKRPRWPELANYRGSLGKSVLTLKETLDRSLSIERKLSKLFSYAHLRHDEDIALDEHKVAYQKIMTALHEFAQETSWIEPEILALPDETIKTYLESDELKTYRFYLEKIVRMKKHTLTPEKEELMAMSAQALQTSHKTFSAINDADFKFGSVKDEKGHEREITHASYGVFLREHDRILRKNSFVHYHNKFENYENTLCELLNGQVQAHIFNARARSYPSSLDAALFPKNIDTSVYHSLVKAVNDEIDTLHKYIALRKRVMGVKELHLYDVYVPLIKEVDIKMPYQEAVDLIVESVAPLGSEYQSLLKIGLNADRWVDRYENKNKRSGAYSSGCYDSMPYILMNYKDVLRDVFTLAHEAGHSMHSLYSRTNQPYHYSDYPIFLAEVASTFNEDLLTRHMLSQTKEKFKKIYLLNQKIEDIRATLFRQTMFAEFELLIHTLAEKGVPLTPALLKDEYRNLNTKYFGHDAIIDPEIEIEWARIPHFYYNFYVYQYATGISAALALCEKVVEGGSKDRDAYLSFLKSGSSKYPIELLQIAGVDMRSPMPVKAAIGKFRNMVDELETLLIQ